MALFYGIHGLYLRPLNTISNFGWPGLKFQIGWIDLFELFSDCLAGLDYLIVRMIG